MSLFSLLNNDVERKGLLLVGRQYELLDATLRRILFPSVLPFDRVPRVGIYLIYGILFQIRRRNALTKPRKTNLYFLSKVQSIIDHVVPSAYHVHLLSRYVVYWTG